MSYPKRSFLVLSITMMVGISLSLLASIFVGKCNLLTKQTQLNTPVVQKSPGVYISWQALAVLGTGLGLTTLLGIYLRLQQQDRERLENALKQQIIQQQQQEKQLAESALLIQQTKTTAELATKANHNFLIRMDEELNSPVHLILGYTQLLQCEPSLNNTTRSYLDLLNCNTLHLLSLINQLLEMSKLESGQIAVNLTSFNLHYLLESIKNQLEVKAISKGLRLTFFISEDVPFRLKTDENKLRLVLLYLLNHCIKYTDFGSVTLRAGMVSSSWIIEEDSSKLNPAPYFLFFEIEDTGSGMDAQELKMAFDAFQFTEIEKEVGFGLALSRKLIELMGGKIIINSNSRKTNIVKVKLPVTIDEVEDWQTTLQLPGRVIGLAPEQPEYRILIADDKGDNRQLLVNLLKPLGFQLLEVENGQQAVNLWSSWHPHLIWMDTRMPIMDGYEAIHQIRQLEEKNNTDESNSRTIIIVLCSGILEEDQADSLASGCDDVIYKPIEVEMLLQKMAQYLGIRYLYDIEDVETHVNNDNPSTLSLSYIRPSSITQLSLKIGSSTSRLSQDLSPDSLQVLSISLRTSIYEAASAGDSMELYQIIQQISETDHLLASELTNLVDQFNFRKLRELTKLQVHINNDEQLQG